MIPATLSSPSEDPITEADKATIKGWTKAMVEINENWSKQRSEIMDVWNKNKNTAARDAAEIQANNQSIATKNQATTAEVVSVIDKELALLIPQLQEKKYGSVLGNGDAVITAEELRAYFTGQTPYDTLSYADHNDDGILSFDEVSKRLPLPLQSATPRQNGR